MLRQNVRAIAVTTLSFLISTAGLADPVPLGMEFQVNTYTTGDQDAVALEGLEDGGFVVVYESVRDGDQDGIALRRLDAAGSPVGDEIQVNTYITGEQADPRATELADGSFVVVWDSLDQDGSFRGVFGQRYDAAGNPLGGELQLTGNDPADQNDAVVASQPAGGFVIVWEDYAFSPTAIDLVGHRFDSAGLPVGNDFAVNTTLPANQEDPDLATAADGSFVVVWESTQDGNLDGVFGRRFDSAGTAIGGEFQINTYTTGNQDDPRLAVAGDGTFVVVWEDDTQDPTGGGVFARFFDGAANPLTGEFQVDEFDSGVQQNPQVTFDSGGNAAFIWDSLPQDGDGEGIYVRRFDTSGAPESGELLVNSSTLGPQVFGAIAVDGNGRLLTAWVDFNDLDGDLRGVFAQRFDDGLFADGFESGDTSAW